MPTSLINRATIIERVNDYLANDPHTPVSTMAMSLGLSEAEVTFSLPDTMVSRVSHDKSQTILEALPTWGPVTVIVHSVGSIFEFKAEFPKGKVSHGYYNLIGSEGQLHGHLLLEEIGDIALVSKPFRGSESHYIGFFDNKGHCIFKVYLGRDKKRRLFPAQVTRFTAMKLEWTND